MRRTTLVRIVIAVALAAAWHAGVTIASQRSAGAMTTAANKFLEGLTPDQRQRATFPVGSEEMTRWNFIPTSMFPRNGVPLKDMTEPQRKLAMELLQTGLSQKGYTAATTIMELENILKVIEAGTNAPVRDPELYFFSIFGTPGPKAPWGWRVEGHHVSLRFTIANGTDVRSTPSFLGSNPAQVLDGDKKGLRVLGALEDAGRALVMALDDTQRTTAIINAVAPNEIVTNTKLTFDPLTPAGLPASAMNEAQRKLLTQLLQTYAGEMTDDVAAERMQGVEKAGLEKVAFAWAGETEPGKKHYYRVQGPTFLIEFDNTQNNGNHVHSVWRDFNGDFGRDLLREHVTNVKH